MSTVGQLWLDRLSREIHARVHDSEWLNKNKHLRGDDFDYAYMKKFGFETIGCDRIFETMVFEAGKPCAGKECDCGLPAVMGSDLDFKSYNDTGAATKGHMRLCKKWAKK